jgi:cell division protein FtsZ
MEGKKRLAIAEQGIAELGKYVDSLITIPNEKLLSVLGPETTLLDAFRAANEVLQGAVQGIAELITRPGLINVDFADVRTVMSEMGMAMMGSGTAKGPDRAREAAEAAISSPLLEDVNLSGARGILVNVTAGENLGIGEFRQVGETVKQCASEDATVVIGTVIDPEMGDTIRVTVVATGLGQPVVKQQPQMRVVAQAQAMAYRGHGALAGHHGHAQAQQPMGSPQMAEGSGYGAYDQPTFIRQRAVGDQLAEGTDASFDLLDVPAFLRRQAD